MKIENHSEEQSTIFMEKHLMTPEDEDFIKGMSLLRKNVSSLGLDAYFSLSTCKWIVPLSRILSNYRCCYLFWKNASEQNRLKSIKSCETIDDLFFSDNYIFIWGGTCEGYIYWHNIFYELLNKFQLTENTYLKCLA